MRRISIVIVILLLWACETSTNVAPEFRNYFIRTYGGDGDQEGIDFVVNADNTITILGNSITPAGSRFIYIAKVTAEGDLLWEKTLGGGAENAQDIEPLFAGGGYIILSNIATSSLTSDIHLIKINDAGDVLLDVIYNPLEDQFGNSITPLANGNYFVAGKTDETDPNNVDNPVLDQDVLVVLLDVNLDEIESTRVGSSTFGEAIRVLPTSSDKFIYAGFYDEAEVSTDQDFVFRLFSSQTNLVEATLRTGGVTENEVMKSFIRNADGSFLAVGYVNPVDNLSFEIYVAVINGNNTLRQGQKLSLGTSRVQGVDGTQSTFSGGYLLITDDFSLADATRDIRLIKVNSTLQEEWSVSYGTSGNDDYSAKVAELAGGEILMLGTLTITNQKKIALIRVNPQGSFND